VLIAVACRALMQNMFVLRIMPTKAHRALQACATNLESHVRQQFENLRHSERSFKRQVRVSVLRQFFCYLLKNIVIFILRFRSLIVGIFYSMVVCLRS
jgi:hypothetical protein